MKISVEFENGPGLLILDKNKVMTFFFFFFLQYIAAISIGLNFIFCQTFIIIANSLDSHKILGMFKNWLNQTNDA